MAEVGSAFVTIIPSAKGFGAALNSQVAPGVAATGTAGGKKFGGTFATSAKSALKGFGALFAVGVVTQGIKSVVAEARESQKVSAVTAQHIKTMGGAANVTAAQVGRLATSISNKTGVDDEAIQKGSNLLLTFRNVRNEAGKGNKVFNEATKAAVDLSASGFGSIESSSKMLGKALNDPVKGMTALGRAGVTFTAGQQKQIKALVKSGDLLGAQKIILGEVKSQVGGTAAASATAGEKMRTAWNNAKESIGTALLPAIDKLQIAITTKVIPAIVKFVGFLQKNPAIVKAFAIGIAAIAAAFVVAFVAANAIAIGIGVVAAALVYAYTKSETFRQVVQIVFSVVKTIILTHMKIIVTAIKVGIAVVKAVWATIKAIVGFVRGAFNAAKSIVSTVIGAIKTTVSTGLGKVVQFFKDMPGKIKKAFGNAKDMLVGIGKSIVAGLKSGISGAFDKMKKWFTDKIDGLISAARKKLLSFSPSRVFIKIGESVGDGMFVGVKKSTPQVTTAVTDMATFSTLPTSGFAAPRLSAITSAGSSSFEASLVGARVEMGKDGFAQFTDGRIRMYDQRGAIDARFATR